MCIIDHTRINEKGFYVYRGLDKVTLELVYIGTTVQIPRNRFRWHKANGKDLKFEVIKVCVDADQMINHEFELIQSLKPKLNKITHRRQNLNVKLTADELDSRKGSKEWCQGCLKRRVNKGYRYCRNC